MAEREKKDARDRDKLIVNKTDEAKGMVRVARDRDCNSRDKDIVVLFIQNKNMSKIIRKRN